MIYFLIDKNDTLIYKQIATKQNTYEGYVITDENRIVIETRPTIVEKPKDLVLEEGTLWASEGDDIEYETFEDFHFDIIENTDTIVDISYFKKLDIIKNRRIFIEMYKNFNEFEEDLIFIEPMESDKFVLRKVEPVNFE